MGKTPEIINKLKKFGINPNTGLGQHMLVDEKVLDLVANQVQHGANVLEVGPGPGNLTEKVAPKADSVVSIEIDRRYQPLLESVQSSHPNVQIVYGDALAFNYPRIIKGKDQWQIISDLPFHISEPFLPKIIDLPIEEATLVVGNQLARKMHIEDPYNPEYSKTSLLTQTFFDADTVSEISRNSFYPEPRTGATLVNLTPREKDEFHNPGRSILRNLFLSARKNPTVAKVIRESAESSDGSKSQLPKTDYNRQQRRKINMELRQRIKNGVYSEEPTQVSRQNRYSVGELEKLDLPNNILSTPFSRLDNQSIRDLTVALKKRYGEL